MLGIMRLTSRVHGEKINFVYTIRKKFTKGEVCRRLMKEYKQSFGKLLETKKQKIQRLKRQGTEVVDENVDPNGVSEFSWMMKVSDARLRRINVSGGDKLSAASTEIPRKIFIPIGQIIQEKACSHELGKSMRKMYENESSDKLISKEEKIARLIKETELPRVQTRIIHKSSELETTIEHRSGFVVAKKTLIQVPRLHRPKFTMQVLRNPKPSKERRATMESKGREKIVATQVGTSETTTPISSLSSKSSDKDDVTTETECQRDDEPMPMTLLPENIIQNIDKAELFHNDEGDSDHSWLSSKILSISRTEDKECLEFPSVTKILSVTMPNSTKKMLELWMARMINQMGEEAFNEYRTGLLENGKLLHSSIDNSLRNLPVYIPEKLKPCFDSLRNVLGEVEDVRAIESHVVHRSLGYRGVLDCVASYRGNLCLIDWKKSDRPKRVLSATYDAPLQIASYIGALNADKNYPFQIKSGVIVVAYTAGHSPTIYQCDGTKLQYYWNKWLGRLKKYYTMQNT